MNEEIDRLPDIFILHVLDYGIICIIIQFACFSIVFQHISLIEKITKVEKIYSNQFKGILIGIVESMVAEQQNELCLQYEAKGVMRHQHTSSSGTDQNQGIQNNQKFMGNRFNCGKTGHKTSECRSETVQKYRDREESDIL